MSKNKKRKKKKEDGGEFDNMVEEFRQAVDENCWMVCVFSMNGNQVRMFRKTGGSPGFPVDDFSTAVDLLDTDLRKERERIEGETTPVPLLGKTQA